MRCWESIMQDKRKWSAPNGWYTKSPGPSNGLAGALDDKKIRKYALKGHYGETARRAAVKAQKEERALAKAEKQKAIVGASRAKGEAL